jgi:hypothetical protein
MIDYRYRHPLACIAAVVLAGTMLMVAFTSSARANAYHDFLCRVPYGPNAGRAAPADDLVYTVIGYYVLAEDTCASGGSLAAAIDGELPHPYGAGAAITFNAPAGLTIDAFTLWRYESDGPAQPYGAPASNLDYSPGPPSVQGLCAQSFACSSRGTPSYPLDPSNAVSVSGLSGVTQIQWSASCGGGPGGECPLSGSTTLASQYDVYAADIDLHDGTPPSVSDVSGPLAAGGTLSGQQTISFSATDGQSGVYGGMLVVDGRVALARILDRNGGACESLGVTTDGQRSFEHPQPCKSSLSASLTLDTDAYAAGTHSLELVVEDAAGNQTVAYDGRITTSGPSAGGVNGSISAPAIANGQSPCAREALDLEVNGKAKAPVIAYGKQVTVGGMLHCGAVPIRDATVALSSVGGPAGAALAATVRTAPDGSFSYSVPTGPDRTLRFSYTAYSDDHAPSATASVAIRIRPRIELRIAPQRTSNGNSISWSGTVAGAPYPSAGVTLDVEVSELGRWRIFEQIVARHKGRFHYRYRFHATTEPTTYAFRVALPANGAQGYPYTPGASNTVAVHVAP